MLFTIKAIINKIVTPERTGSMTYINPSALIFSVPILAISAVAPPGVCKVFVICMATIEIDTAKAQANQFHSGLGIRYAMLTPMHALIRCPPTRFLGCASGLFVAPYTSTAEAPKEPINEKFSKGENRECWSHPIIPIPKKAPINVQI